MAIYIIAPSGSSGSGTLVAPWGIPDLFSISGANVVQGVALTTLAAGDTLYFRTGNYHLNGIPASGGVYPTTSTNQLIGPSVSGTALAPITFAPYPGEENTVTLTEDTGVNPVVGTFFPTTSYVRFLGFTIKTTYDAATGLVGSGGNVSGTGCVYAWNEFVGSTIPGTDNHPGVHLFTADGTWVHHNYVHDVQGSGSNSSGIEEYKSTNCIFEDNWVDNCTDGLHDKDANIFPGGNNNTYRRNWVSNSIENAFVGNNQGAVATYFIYDNVFENPFFGIDIGNYGTTSGVQLYNNLLLCNYHQVFSNIGDATTYKLNVWNNIVLFSGAALTSYWDNYKAFPGVSPLNLIDYFDYNVYDAIPSYLFAGGTQTLAQFQSNGFETHAILDSAANIFVDLVSYVLKTPYQTAGRFGDMVGPRYPISLIRDPSRYGPAAFTPTPTPTPTTGAAALLGAM